MAFVIPMYKSSAQAASSKMKSDPHYPQTCLPKIDLQINLHTRNKSYRDASNFHSALAGDVNEIGSSLSRIETVCWKSASSCSHAGA
jgi:hypothetical protein